MMEPYFEDTESGIVIYHADCRDVLPELDAVDLVLTDPPYGVGLQYDCYDDTPDNWRTLMKILVPFIKDHAQMGIMPCARMVELKWIYDNFPPDWLIAWYKGSPGTSAWTGFNDWEPHLVYGKTKGVQFHDHFSLNPKPFVNGHPCAKPPKWAMWLIGRASFPGQLVVDPCLGSGTTLAASKRLGRKGIGIELSERYCEIAARQIMATPRPLFTEPTPERPAQQELF